MSPCSILMHLFLVPLCVLCDDVRFVSCASRTLMRLLPVPPTILMPHQAC